MPFIYFVAILLFSLLTAGCSHRAAQLPNLGHVPSFAATDSQGKQFEAEQMDGKVWIVDFIYTNCPGPCPMMSSKMRQMEQKTGPSGPMFLSVSVDPARDTPGVLNAFAHRFGAPNDRWFFLSGTPKTVHLLARETFKVGDVITVLDHSTKLILVDKKRDLRGYYSSFDPESVSTMLADADALLKQGD